MNTNYIINKGFTFKRITKSKARAAYNNGLTVLICPCKANPFGLMGHGTMNKSENQGAEFETLDNTHRYYNCNSQMGYYNAYYIPVRTVDGFTLQAVRSYTTNMIEAYDYSYMAQ